MHQKDKLYRWVEKKIQNGTIDFNAVPSWISNWNFPKGMTVEDICRDINKMLEANEKKQLEGKGI
jgi:hypothetical protein